MPRNAPGVLRQPHDNSFYDRPSDAEIFRPVSHFGGANDVRRSFRVVTLDMRHQKNGETHRLAMNETCAALLLERPSQDMFRTGVESSLWMSGEALRKFRADLNNFDKC